MIEKNIFYRPGIAAIAAVLALPSTPVLAQLALPESPAEEASTLVAAPAASVIQAPVQTVQNVPATPLLPNLPVSENATATPRSASTKVKGTVSQSAAINAAVPKRTTAASPVQQSAVKPAISAPVEQRQIAPARPDHPKAVNEARSALLSKSTTVQNQADGTNYASWLLLGSGVLLVLGGATFALRRHPRPRNYGSRDEVVGYATIHPATLPATPEMVGSIHNPVRENLATTPAVSAQPMAAGQDYADMSGPERRAAIEAMVAASPTQANPFRSRRHRVRRAEFLLRTGQFEPHKGEYAATDQHAPDPVSTAKDRWSEMRLRFDQKARVLWRPARG